MCNPVNSKLPAHALVITLVLSLIIGILCLSLLLIGYHNRNTYIQYHHSRILREVKASAIQFCLADSTPAVASLTLESGIERPEIKKQVITRYNWGLYEVNTIGLSTGKYADSAAFFTGVLPKAPYDGCLYVTNHGRSLLLAGDTRLAGTAYVPSGGLQRGTINGTGYLNKELIQGTVAYSEAGLPYLPPETQQGLDQLFVPASRTLSWPLTVDSLNQSFHQFPQVIAGAAVLELRNLTLKGHVLLQAAQRIDVYASTRLENVILVAPIIRIQDGFTGTIQAFATDTLLAGDSTRFYYPSALVLYDKKASASKPLLRIGNNSFLQGLALAVTTDHNKPLIHLPEGSRVEGLVYSSGYVTASGRVAGTIVTDYFRFTNVMGLYENHLFNTRIERPALPEYMALPAPFGYASTKKCVQWVH